MQFSNFAAAVYSHLDYYSGYDKYERKLCSAVLKAHILCIKILTVVISKVKKVCLKQTPGTINNMLLIQGATRRSCKHNSFRKQRL